MVTGERLTITLSGGAPWGFRLQGGGNYPLEVAKIRKNSHSQEAGLKEGDIIISINGHPVSSKSHQSAMDIVEMASDSIVFEVARPAGFHGSSKPLDPQRHPRIIPMVSGFENAAPGIVTSAHGGYTSTEGNTRKDVYTDEYTMRTGDGRRVTKTVTEQRTTRYGGSSGGVSPAVSHTSLGSTEHKSRSPNRSPLVWQPPSLNRANIQKSQSSLDISYGHKKSSPVMWQPRSLSPSPGSHGRPASVQSGSLDRMSLRRSSRDSRASKENVDPFILREQKKWEATHSFDTPKYNNYNDYRPGGMKYVPPKMDDPNYPMFELPKKVEWTPPKINVPPAPISSPEKKWAPPVPPKPVSTSPSPIPFDPSEREVAGVNTHHPGMIRPPVQPNLMPAPPPPPLPPSPSENPRFNVVSIQSKFEPGHFSTPNQPGYDEPDPAERPTHLHVFQPKVMFTPDEDSGMASPDRYDGFSDISAHRKKIFSDSAFYDDATNRYPTIDEQMSMCKKIAQSLTSFANNRARGARMFARRKRKANKWIHERRGFGSEFSSSAGDVADLNDLDSELYYDEGGNKPLFTFRIPKVASQVSTGQRMSLSKQEFERLRLSAPKVDHHGVSPNTCFTIAADLHKGGKNRGAKLFQKRQQRVEKFVIDDTNVLKSPTSTKLDFIVQNPPQPSPEKSPWSAAAQGDVSKAFTPHPLHSMPLQPLPKHNLEAENQPKLIGGKNFNKRAQGWQGFGPGVQQQSYYRESHDPSTGTSRSEWYQEQSSAQSFNPDAHPRQLDQYGNYNRLIKAFPEQEKPERKPVEQGDYNRRIKAWPEPQETPPQTTLEYGDYNRKIKAWPESVQSTLPKQSSQQSSYSVQSSYYSLPRGFKAGGSNPKQTVQQHHQQFRQVYQQQEQLPGCDL
ncbi:uncharacterized protein LOC123563980 isoform X2 [Mercenaria mercenaria]|uniref:uncharacterized protein LOC123563980 isoform X2 n=1 Tax=Mercenaria mercenaria TaxID=6596 RepID=UPI00234F64DB|nr:uncharacterized protein LOC123563980 isoform X2 [Mercenaria mercenaria]